MDEDLVNIGFLAKGYGPIFDVVSDADAEEPTNKAEINELEKVAHFSLDVCRRLRRVSDDGEVIGSGGQYDKIVAINMIESSLVSLRNFEAKAHENSLELLVPMMGTLLRSIEWSA